MLGSGAQLGLTARRRSLSPCNSSFTSFFPCLQRGDSLHAVQATRRLACGRGSLQRPELTIQTWRIDYLSHLAQAHQVSATPMRKLLRNKRPSRQTRSKTRQQHEALLDRAMESKPEQPAASDPTVLSIFLNDFTDSDNEAAGLLWAWSLDRHPEREGIYIAEPRHVNLGYYMTSVDFGRCIALVSRLQPPLESGDLPLTTVLSGRMTRDIVNSRQVDGRPLNEEERELVSYITHQQIANTCLRRLDDGSTDSKTAGAMHQARKWFKRRCRQTCASSHNGLLVHHEDSL